MDIPRDGNNLTQMVEISAGDSFSMALGRNNSVYAWGDNTYSQLGNDSATTYPWLSSGTDTKAIYPIRVQADPNTVRASEVVQYNGTDYLTNIVGISASGKHVNVLSKGNETTTDQLGTDHAVTGHVVYAWGRNDHKQLGVRAESDGTYAATKGLPTPTLFSLGKGAYDGKQEYFTDNTFAVGSGENHSVVIGRDGYIYDWGKGDMGATGNANITEKAAPVRVGTREDSVLIYDPDYYTGQSSVHRLTTDAAPIVLQNAYGTTPATEVTLNLNHIYLRSAPPSSPPRAAR